MRTKTEIQRNLFETPKETDRKARLHRLLGGLNLPPERINTANMFDYDKATLIAKGNRR